MIVCTEVDKPPSLVSTLSTPRIPLLKRGPVAVPPSPLLLNYQDIWLDDIRRARLDKEGFDVT